MLGICGYIVLAMYGNVDIILFPTSTKPYNCADVKCVLMLNPLKTDEGMYGFLIFGIVIWIKFPETNGTVFVMLICTELGAKNWQFLLPIPLLFIAILQELKVVLAEAIFIYVGKSIVIDGVWLKPWVNVIFIVYDDIYPIALSDNCNPTWLDAIG